MKVGANHKKKFEEWLSARFRDGGIASHEQLARHVVLLMDGGLSTVLVHRDPDYIEVAGTAAKSLVNSALN